MCGSAYDNKIKATKPSHREEKQCERKNERRLMKEKRIVVYNLQIDDKMMVKRNRVDLNNA